MKLLGYRIWFILCAAGIVTDAMAATGLAVGDRLPDYTFTNLINYPTKTARVSDFRGKLFILDFWGTGCSSCVESWPKLEKLQHDFAGQVQILLVNPWQNEAVVWPLIEKRKVAGIVNLTLPSVCEDRKLLELFDVYDVPHIVWVDALGVIRSVTNGSELNATNIKAMLGSGEVTMRQKEILNREVPALLEAPDDRMLWQSTLSGYRPGMRSTMDAFANAEAGYFIRVLNLPPRELYRVAYADRIDRYGYLLSLPISRIRLDTKDSLRCQAGPGKIPSDTAHYYTYELVTKMPVTLAQLQRRMQQDMDALYPWRAYWEKRIMPCLVLTATDTMRLRYTGGRHALNITDADFQVNKVTITDLINYMVDVTGYGMRPYPLVDETNFAGRIGGIDLSVNVYNIDVLRRALLPHGLSLQVADRAVQVLVISDQP